MVTEDVKVRIVQPEEWDAIRAIFDQEGGVCPSPEHATAAVAIDDKGPLLGPDQMQNLAGFWTLQTVLHAGPLWIRPDHRGTRLWWPLNQCLAHLVEEMPGPSGFYSFSSGPRMNHVFGQLGYQELNYRVWKREV